MRSVSVVLILVVATMVSTAPTSEKPHYDVSNAPALFEKYIKDYNKIYKDAADREEHYRAFVVSLELINKLNAQPSNTATFDINHLADYTPDETKYLHGPLPEY